MNKNKNTEIIDFDDILAEKMKDPAFSKYFDEYGRQLELACQIIRLRKSRKMSQSELAKKIGTTQSNIARIEGGRQNFTISLLDKVAKALEADLTIRIAV